MAPDDESGSGSPLAELLTAATAQLRWQQQDHRTGVGRKG